MLLKFKLPAISNTGITDMPIAISYEIICALARMPPRKGNLEFAA